MALSRSVQRMRESFEAQFEASDAGKFVYRKNLKGAPIPVSSQERERFTEQYVRRIWTILIGMVIALLAFWGLLIWWLVMSGSELPNLPVLIGTLFIAIIAIAFMYWVRGAPARELRDRSPVGRGRTSDEMHTIFMAKTTYGQLLAAAGFGVFIIVIGPPAHERSDSAWSWFYLALGGGLIVFAAVRAFQKWRFDSHHPNDVL
jgi:drug/metabolite transporter (DMT)-like permease